ncbi:hypothetical protein Q8W67_12215 [Methylobacterium sp. NEAU K]|nr:hypothetical protein [Methylobacterium sp. NEAU K]MDP4004225.1 hypothetical protein [Methylobacterium sp. NEAU K]
MTDSDAVLAIPRADEAELRRGLLHAALFGSVPGGEPRAGSELDVMIAIDAPVADAGNAHRHGYRSVTLDIPWLTVHDEWPVLVAACRAGPDRAPDL